MLSLNFKQTISNTKIKHLKKKISSEYYTIERLSRINEEIQYWKVSQKKANTNLVRNYCNMIINMYLKRYNYYLNK